MNIPTLVFALVGIFLSGNLSAQPGPGSNKPEIKILTSQTVNGRGHPNGRSDSADPYFRLFKLEVSDDPAYGFSPDNPIRVGPITARGAHLFYLNSLRGQNGEPVEYERIGACCSFDDASLPMGGGLIDVYKISIDGRTDALTLFVDMYRKGPPKIPAGFTPRPYGPSTQPSPNSELNAVLQKLSATATSEQFNQIKSAINASPALMAQLNDLSSSGNLRAIRVSTPDAIPMIQGIRFGAIREGSQFVLSSILLQELLKNRIHDAGKENDILPDNTVFVLSHLAYHARTNEEMARLDIQTKSRIDELSKTKGVHDYTEILLHAQRVKIENESSAFIQGWNHVVEAAIIRNGNRTLSVDQFSTLLMNLRYRFAFVKALRLPENPVQFSNTGTIEMNERNVRAIAAALSTSQMADIQ